MLSEEERAEIEEEATKYKYRKAVGPEALKIVQKNRRWISDETLKEVAAFLGMTADELDSVATCYNLIFRRPVGRHVIFICDSVSCWIMGYEDVRDYLFQRLGVSFGQTTSDGRFTLLPIACLGACDEAPAMIVDEQLYTMLDAAQIDAILERYQ
ncbi:MAG: NADH-quinone oxidoreductase subunit NuoE [Candidatus Abyssobacteria bacterium SURF_5]|uniref:NADH-quinone oxidoreductase subunit NuoE n=1 Tax=Abyssobacteria bacterium (strain SURF_5) TaxID=2093360 RepID=A0A3A4NGB8_ABYX5|nr:MAG: NADH-quinone oxidoreductase subunit NuoE [Candidatus Abyssubacteria bacterium SURF_5]